MVSSPRGINQPLRDQERSTSAAASFLVSLRTGSGSAIPALRLQYDLRTLIQLKEQRMFRSTGLWQWGKGEGEWPFGAIEEERPFFEEKP